MRNPNNRKCPNLWATNETGIAKFKRDLEARGIAELAQDPMNFIGFGLSYAEAVYLNHCKSRIENAKCEMRKQKAII